MGGPELSGRLLQTLQGLHEGNASDADLHAELQRSDVVVPKPEGGGVEDSSVSLPLLEVEGRDVVPLFSSPETLAQGAPAGMAYVVIPFAALASGWPDGLDAILDLGSGWARELPAAAITGWGPVEVPAGTRVFLGEPAEEPEALLDRLRSHLSGEPDVEAAWRAQVMVDQPGETPHLAIGLMLTPGADAQTVIRRTMAVALPAVTGPIDLVLVEQDSSDAVAGYMLENEPFYRREGH
jgi:hypothetical protein